MKAIVLLSGGMDSVTLLAHAINKGLTCETISFCYGSKHNQYENEAAKNVSDHYKVKNTLIDLSEISKHLESNLLKTGDKIPEGHYEESNMSKTVVPGRNLIFISVALGIAWTRKAEKVYIGAHSGDHVIYPDCRPPFVRAMKDAVYSGSGRLVSLEAPFLHGVKTTILKEGFALNVPYHLTRTCYKDQKIACGKCGACQERLEAFRNHDKEDPIEYESREIFSKDIEVH